MRNKAGKITVRRVHEDGGIRLGVHFHFLMTNRSVASGNEWTGSVGMTVSCFFNRLCHVPRFEVTAALLCHVQAYANRLFREIF